LTARIAAEITPPSQQPAAVILAAWLHDAGIEERLTQSSHAEVGAYLLSFWGLPHSIVEAVAHHHHPSRAASNKFDMVVTVYVANLLAD
jgi:HD-like signal output (HDOD) protein